jgi:DNA-binding transcriptional ArsR family regulator
MTHASVTAGQSFTDAAPLFAALGDETRLEILARLSAAGPLSISRLAMGANISRQAITKHLLALSDAGLARSERSGRESLWRLESLRLAEARAYLNQISAQWDEALARLAALVQGDAV